MSTWPIHCPQLRMRWPLSQPLLFKVRLIGICHIAGELRDRLTVTKSTAWLCEESCALLNGLITICEIRVTNQVEVDTTDNSK
jgi:hypothetical protein